MAAVSPVLRPMRWWHVPEVAAIERTVFGATAWSEETYFGELAAPDRWLHLALEETAGIRGYIDVALGGREADLMTIAVRPDSQGRGIGSELLSAGIAAAAAAGAHRMLLEVRAGNPARGLYERHGFVQLDVRRGYYPDGADAIVMRRTITESGAGS